MLLGAASSGARVWVRAPPPQLQACQGGGLPTSPAAALPALHLLQDASAANRDHIESARLIRGKYLDPPSDGMLSSTVTTM
jgi:hypothetical protein